MLPCIQPTLVQSQNPIWFLGSARIILSEQPGVSPENSLGVGPKQTTKKLQAGARTIDKALTLHAADLSLVLALPQALAVVTPGHCQVSPPTITKKKTTIKRPCANVALSTMSLEILLASPNTFQSKGHSPYDWPPCPPSVSFFGYKKAVHKAGIKCVGHVSQSPVYGQD